ncbi:hypothetical protein V8G54_032222 [Vigna mungo]|uniref:Reverse transcriptase RNase H-like domain-containing protein n=1 Tax=Vigna mungo TaxID=3915 RepID=A0AAQ3MMI3_VIGMU
MMAIRQDLQEVMQILGGRARDQEGIFDVVKRLHYLIGHKFIIKTDQKSLKELVEQCLQTPEQQQWLPKFLGFDFTIQYKPGKQNVPTDALSRSVMMAWSEPTNQWFKAVATAIQKDVRLKELYDQCLTDPLQSQDYRIKEGFIVLEGSYHVTSRGGYYQSGVIGISFFEGRRICGSCKNHG